MDMKDSNYLGLKLTRKENRKEIKNKKIKVEIVSKNGAYSVDLINISEGGIKIRSNSIHEIGDRVNFMLITSQGLEIPFIGEIRYSLINYHGIKFLTEDISKFFY